MFNNRRPNLLTAALIGFLFGGQLALAQTPPAGNPRAHLETPLCSGHGAADGASSLQNVAEAQARRVVPPAFPGVDLKRQAQQVQVSAPPAGVHSLLGPPCSAADFALLSGQPLVDALATSSDACLGSLWSFDAAVAQVIASTHIELMATQMTADASNISASSAALQHLAYVYQIAFFHEFYESTLSYSPTTFAAAQLALVNLGTALDLTPPTVSSLDLIEQWATSVDSTNATVQVLPQCEAILARYNGDPALAAVYQERLIAYRVLFSLSRQVGNNCGQGAASPWYSAITSSLLAEVTAIALNTAYTADDEYLVNNALYVLSRFACLDAATRTQVHNILTTAYQTHAQFSAPWLRAVVDLDAEFNGLLANGTQLDLDLIRSQVQAIALPNEYVFDQGRLVFQTAISLPLAQEMYEAMQEVESQFFRKCSELAPVPGDEQDILTLVIYGSPEDYATFQPFLYGLGTNNGGIFIESWATLFTYDRTPQQSIYTLEELLRHEYVHYLDSRYLVVGSFGEAGTLYAGNRLVWYNEGLAEYLAGSSRAQGVLPRGILLDQIDSDATRLTVADIVGSTYGSFTFYRYAGMFFQFLETQEPELLVALFAAVRGNDVAVLDALYASMAADAALQADFDQYLTAQIALRQSGTGLFAEDVATTPTPGGLAVGNGTAIRQALDTQAGLAGDFHVWPDRFRYSYTKTTATAGEPLEVVREQLDTALDADLTQLAPALTNLQSTVAWCGELVTGLNTVTADYVFEGPYVPDAADLQPPAAPTGLTADAAGGIVTCQWNTNAENDLAGYFLYRSAITGGPYALVTPVSVWETNYTDTDAGTATWYYVVTAIDAAGNESPYSGEVVVESIVDVLVINGYFDSGNAGYYNAYRNTLDALGVTYVDWDPFVDGPVTAALLAGFNDGVVMWPCGYFHGGYPDQLGAARQQLLSDYLAAGGSLIMSGAYVSTSLDNTALFNTYFHLDHLQWGMEYSTLLGAAADPVGAGLQLQITGSGGYRSELALTAPAQPAFSYDPTSGSTAPFLGTGVAACTVDATHQILFLAFPFADLTTGSRSDLLASALAWMNPPDPCPNPYLRGDVNGSGDLDIADVVYLLAFLFSAGPPATVADAADVNSDGGVDISDPIFVLGYLFNGGGAPAAPFPVVGCP
ncbi:MAG: collagenase [Planctomycetota bacterium]